MGDEAEAGRSSSEDLKSRPGIFFVGAPNVGKRSLLSRLLSVDISETVDLSSGVLCHGWSIDTKYYSANLSIWTTNLDEDFSFSKLPFTTGQIHALVMVFDLSDESSFVTLQSWISTIEMEKFDVLLCVGNKADLLPGHPAHREYRRRLKRHGESTCDPHPEFFDYGIDETEGFSLLGDQETSWDLHKSCLEWCSDHKIEFIEACASNEDFDKCLSVHGDVQGVERIYGALSAHLWPGMVLKSGDRMRIPAPVLKEEVTTDESDYELEYELLSGSDEPWDGADGSDSFGEFSGSTSEVGTSSSAFYIRTSEKTVEGISSESMTPTTSNGVNAPVAKGENGNSEHKEDPPSHTGIAGSNDLILERSLYASDNDDHLDLDDLERLMGEISNMRDNLRLLPDVQRREMAANLALKMATMFGDDNDNEGF